MSGEYFTNDELVAFGFSKVGHDVRVSRKCSIYGADGTIGDGCRIDDFVILKGRITLGKKVHVCSHSSLSGVGGRITIGDFCGIGVANIFYTASDDLLRAALSGPLVDRGHTVTKTGDICIEPGSALGGRVTVMPGVTVGVCAAVGHGALITQSLAPHSVYMTVNGRLKKIASRDQKKLERLLQDEGAL